MLGELVPTSVTPADAADKLGIELEAWLAGPVAA